MQKYLNIEVCDTQNLTLNNILNILMHFYVIIQELQTCKMIRFLAQLVE